jgi:NAD(P)-dependent dehydrogenase (short-subunit alcohol dehydrogenase family)
MGGGGDGSPSGTTQETFMRPTPLLEGKVAVITGASRGIGAATARVFSAEGASLSLAARDEAALSSLADELSGGGKRAIAVPTDVGDAAAVERLVAETVRSFGRLDLAVNNAAGGGQPPTPLAELPIDAYDSAIAITLRSVFLSLKYEIPAMLTSGGARSSTWRRRRVPRRSAASPPTSPPSTESSD